MQVILKQDIVKKSPRGDNFSILIVMFNIRSVQNKTYFLNWEYKSIKSR